MTSANAQHGLVGVDDHGHHHQLHDVALGAQVADVLGTAAAVIDGVDVVAAGDKEAVVFVHQSLNERRVVGGGQDHRDAARLQNGIDIAQANLHGGMVHAVSGQNADAGDLARLGHEARVILGERTAALGYAKERLQVDGLGVVERAASQVEQVHQPFARGARLKAVTRKP